MGARPDRRRGPGAVAFALVSLVRQKGWGPGS